uniref:RFX-type winged-helix domain-containing protein n=1 Tax=Branchiostoma floridae TaxID=7739 RepID=C3ZXR0_BRAFL|eukprot:XP_002586651.1 hypothetical protein BRAFLDRAFT_105681 [Branchiostoma floridae]
MSDSPEVVMMSDTGKWWFLKESKKDALLHNGADLGTIQNIGVPSCVGYLKILVGMLTLDVQTLRPDALAGIRIIDHGPHRQAAQDPNRVDSYQQAQQTGQRQQLVTATVSSAHSATPSQGGREIDSETFTCSWLNSLYEVDSEGSVARIDLYADYLSSCSKLARVGILTSTHFYRCVKTLFPNTGSKRVDTNGQVVYHISGIKKRAVPLHINYSLLQAKAQAASPTVQGGVQVSRSKPNPPPVGASPPPQQLPVVSNQVTSQPNLALATNIPGQPNVVFVQAAPNIAGQNPAVPLSQPIQQASAVYPTAIHQALLGNVQVPCSSNVTQSPTVPAQNVSAAPLPMGIVFQTKNAGIPSTVILTQVPQQLPVGQTAPIQVSGTNLSGSTFIVGQVNMAPGQILQPQAANDGNKSGSIIRQLLLPKPERHDSNQRLILPKPPPSAVSQTSFSSVANVQVPPQVSPQPSGKNTLPPLPVSPEPNKAVEKAANPAQQVAVPNNPDRVICSQVEVAKDVIGPNTGMHEDERRIEVIENHSRKTLEDKIASSGSFHQSGTAGGAPTDSINQSQTNNPLPVNSVDQSGTSGKEAVNQSGEGTKLPQESVDLSAEKHSGLSNGPLSTKVAQGTNDMDVPLVNGVSDSEKEDEKMQITEEKEEEKEGPITKSVRLTATLILRNVAKHSVEGRRKIQRYEEHLSYLALSNLESANFIAKCLGFVFQPEQSESQRDNPPYVR